VRPFGVGIGLAVSLILVACSEARTTSPTISEPPERKTFVPGRALAEAAMTNEPNGPTETENSCFATRYSANGYEFSFKESCAAAIDEDALGEDTGEAPSLRVSVDVTFLSPAERASTVHLRCFYDHSGIEWARAYSFLVSPDGFHSILRSTSREQFTVIAASSQPAASVGVRTPTVVEADCAQSADSVVLVMAINGSEFLVARDDRSANPYATFGDAMIGIAGGSVGFKAAVANLRVTELRAR
jgi:hypothetical protein